MRLALASNPHTGDQLIQISGITDEAARKIFLFLGTNQYAYFRTRGWRSLQPDDDPRDAVSPDPSKFLSDLVFLIPGDNLLAEPNWYDASTRRSYVEQAKGRIRAIVTR